MLLSPCTTDSKINSLDCNEKYWRLMCRKSLRVKQGIWSIKIFVFEAGGRLTGKQQRLSIKEVEFFIFYIMLFSLQFLLPFLLFPIYFFITIRLFQIFLSFTFSFGSEISTKEYSTSARYMAEKPPLSKGLTLIQSGLWIKILAAIYVKLESNLLTFLEGIEIFLTNSAQQELKTHQSQFLSQASFQWKRYDLREAAIWQLGILFWIRSFIDLIYLVLYYLIDFQDITSFPSHPPLNKFIICLKRDNYTFPLFTPLLKHSSFFNTNPINDFASNNIRSINFLNMAVFLRVELFCIDTTQRIQWRGSVSVMIPLAIQMAALKKGLVGAFLAEDNALLMKIRRSKDYILKNYCLLVRISIFTLIIASTALTLKFTTPPIDFPNSNCSVVIKLCPEGSVRLQYWICWSFNASQIVRAKELLLKLISVGVGVWDLDRRVLGLLKWQKYFVLEIPIIKLIDFIYYLLLIISNEINIQSLSLHSTLLEFHFHTHNHTSSSLHPSNYPHFPLSPQNIQQTQTYFLYPKLNLVSHHISYVLPYWIGTILKQWGFFLKDD